MNPGIRVGIIGDFDPNLRSHTTTNEAQSHATSALSVTLDSFWLPTPSLDNEFSETTFAHQWQK